MKNRAFTLIELLVVIAIISLLAAILFPVLFQRHRTPNFAHACYSYEAQQTRSQSGSNARDEQFFALVCRSQVTTVKRL